MKIFDSHLPDAVEDSRWMRRALRIAAKGYTAPNPMVGCCIVKDGVLVGEGYHTLAGKPHAEAEALSAAGDKAKGATAYVTLEPCSHWGRTPPCADALCTAAVKRVVVATLDSNPKVSGQGLDRIKDAGISVRAGVMESQARKLNEAFFHFHEKKSPFFILKSAVTLDGKTATRTGDSRWITGERSRAFVHQLRAKCSAVMVGIGTLLADDPKLTSRIARRKSPKQPLRIVLDSHLRTPLSSRAVQEARLEPVSAPLLIVTTTHASKEAEHLLFGDGVEILRLESGSDGKVPLKALEEELFQRQIISVLVEGGGTLNAALVEAGMADKILTFIAPKIISGSDAPTSFEGVGIAAMADAIHLNSMAVRRFDQDILIEAYL